MGEKNSKKVCPLDPPADLKLWAKFQTFLDLTKFIKQSMLAILIMTEEIEHRHRCILPLLPKKEPGILHKENDNDSKQEPTRTSKT